MIELAKELLQKKACDLKVIEDEINQVTSKMITLSDKGDFSSDEYTATTKRLSFLNELKTNVVRLNELIDQNEQAKEMLSDESMKDLAKEEIELTEENITNLANTIKEQIVKPLRNDEKKCIVEIRPGVGGVEASLFAEDLYRIYTRYCNVQGFRIEQYSMIYDNEGGIKEATFLVDEVDAYKVLRFESGVHRVQRIPSTESAGRIHTSTASVVILPKFESKDINIEDKELRIDVYRSSGPGGQSVNTTDSAVRVTHIPTGITVACQNGKSQHKNKEMALSILSSKLTEIEEEKKMKEEKEMREASILGGDRSAKIRTYNFQQSRVTDHRVNKSWFNLDQIMDGEIESIVKYVSRALRSQLETD